MNPVVNHSDSPRVKICGITTVDDAISAVNAGADAIGMVFYEPSPRYVSIAVAKQIANAVGPFVAIVGLFVNADRVWVEQVLEAVPLQVLQFHGDETAKYCGQFRWPYMKALRMKADLDIVAAIASYPDASAILLDTYRPGLPGGTGATFDWGRVPAPVERHLPIVVAGGLVPDNVQQAIKATQPYAVDVSGGVELSPGRKDPQKIKEFIDNVNTVRYSSRN
ncbi:N-(5'-phosphoribosyl)anthranilate isomerase [Candidatus Endobugula sertula]|uniref:N-(5'-phosphoribosyl)anthranilate isomerase n=1 Tax=Candidatus Endobugula sertula TaxID=62101 RepID=A0A1D2QR21_9GAMM|nr:N-(5'-phosphoribosyl)anthranilate isomerase [Candidatus Endobugula sertula]